MKLSDPSTVDFLLDNVAWDWVANIITIAACSLVNFAVSDRFVFRGPSFRLEEKP